MPRKFVNNLVYNGGFEAAPVLVAPTNTSAVFIDGTAAGSAVSAGFGWAVQLSANAAGSAQFDSSQFYNGIGSMKLSSLQVNANVEVSPVPANNSFNVRLYGYPLRPSTSYTCTYWMKTNYTSGDSSNGAFVDFVERNAAGSAIVIHPGTAVKTTTGWTLYTVTFTTNAASCFFVPKMRIQGNTGTATLIMDAWYDDIVIAPTSPITRKSAL